ncbi:MAG: type II toxin-antitoxin system HicB family antitoxin [Lachnospiraceae bacterium]|nr:type II toxin-antitoxin system HicB family antitoxin [Lachnospiraceae bacterium]
MLTVYPACFFKEQTGHYSVIFPDLNWLATQGTTLEEAIAMAIECLASYIYTCQQDGDIIPNPSPIANISANNIAKELELEPQEAFVNMIAVDVKEYAKKYFEKSVRKTLTIPAWLNAAALEQGINFSQTLQEALLTKLQAR